jgi:hypothetical protein
MSLHLAPNRECGPCNVCCQQPVILDPALKKPPGVLCANWRSEVGCTIYERRPDSCRNHFCAWRQLPQFDDTWRPDLSNVYIEVKGDPPEHFRHVLPNAPFALKFTLLGELAPQRMGLLATTIASLIDRDVPVILAIAAPPEHLGCHMLLNPALKPFAAAVGKEFMVGFARALRTCLDMPPEKVVID